MKVHIAVLSIAAAVMGSAVAVALGRPHFGALGVPQRELALTHHKTSHAGNKTTPASKKIKPGKTMKILPTAITTTTTPVFAGAGVHIMTGNQTENLLTPDYPLSLNPVAFYQPQYYQVMFQLQAMLNGQPTTVQILQGPGNVIILTARNHTITGTYAAQGTVQLTNLSGNTAYFSILGNQKTSWLGANMLTGTMNPTVVMPLAAELSPYIGGLQTLYPVPEINPGTNVSLPRPITASLLAPFITQCLDEANTLFNTEVGVNSVVLNRSGTLLNLTNLQRGRWRTVRFLLVGQVPIPKEVVSVWNGQTLIYRIGTNQQGQAQSVVLPESQIRRLTRYAQTLSYSTQDSQAGAIAALPIDLAGYQSAHPGAPKLIVENGSQTLLALTYQVPTSSYTIYLPIGWYWWQKGPQIISSMPLTPSSSLSSSSSSFSPSSSPSPSSETGLTHTLNSSSPS